MILAPANSPNVLANYFQTLVPLEASQEIRTLEISKLIMKILDDSFNNQNPGEIKIEEHTVSLLDCPHELTPIMVKILSIRVIFQGMGIINNSSFSHIIKSRNTLNSLLRDVPVVNKAVRLLTYISREISEEQALFTDSFKPFNKVMRLPSQAKYEGIKKLMLGIEQLSLFNISRPRIKSEAYEVLDIALCEANWSSYVFFDLFGRTIQSYDRKDNLSVKVSNTFDALENDHKFKDLPCNRLYTVFANGDIDFYIFALKIKNGDTEIPFTLRIENGKSFNLYKKPLPLLPFDEYLVPVEGLQVGHIVSCSKINIPLVTALYSLLKM